MALLEIRNLSVAFHDRTAARSGRRRRRPHASTRARCSAIVGESGSGKSVAMLAVMGLLPWTATVTADRMQLRRPATC